MKKYVSLTVVALLTVFVLDVSGQNVGIKFGSVWSKANLKYDDASMEPEQKFLITPQLGIVFETPLYEGLFLQTGIMGSINGYRYDATREVDDDNGNPVEVESVERPILIYLGLPMNFGYRYNTNDKFGIFGMVGPVFRYMAYSTHSFKVNGEWDNESTEVIIDGEEKSAFKNFDLALNVEAGVQYDRFKFSLYYAPGLINIFSDDFLGIFPDGSNVHWKNFSFGVNVAVLFGPLE